jgi:hypothetical protein
MKSTVEVEHPPGQFDALEPLANFQIMQKSRCHHGFVHIRFYDVVPSNDWPDIQTDLDGSALVSAVRTGCPVRCSAIAIRWWATWQPLVGIGHYRGRGCYSDGCFTANALTVNSRFVGDIRTLIP